MNKLLFTLLTAFVLVLTSCSTEDIQDPNNLSIEGVWGLTAWNIDDEFDFNNDGVFNTNLLNEIDCTKNETLLFEKNGVVSLNTTFKPSIEIALLNDASNEYSFNVACDTEGVISLATSYTKNGNIILMGEITALIDGNQISVVFEDRIEIYNEDLTQVIDTKDLTLVYEKD